jgi:hypothetical protein
MLISKTMKTGRYFVQVYGTVTVIGMLVASLKYEGVAGALWVIFTLYIGRSVERMACLSPHC